MCFFLQWHISDYKKSIVQGKGVSEIDLQLREAAVLQGGAKSRDILIGRRFLHSAKLLQVMRERDKIE